MVTLERDDEATSRQCESAVTSLLVRYKWQLLDSEEFVQRTTEQVQGNALVDPRRAAIHTYSLELYHACSGAQGEERRNIAYTELHRYLYDIARWRYPDVCEEVAQVALESVFHRFEHCRLPAAFLAFAISRLMDSAKKVQGQVAHKTVSLEMMVGDNDETLGDRLSDNGQRDPLSIAVDQELRARLQQCLAEFLQRHPRATQQIAALRLKYLDGLDEVAISDKLGTTIQNVYVLRSRALEKLERDPTWRAIAREYGILPDDASA